MKKLNYKILDDPTHIVRSTPREYDEAGVKEIGTIQNLQPANYISLRKEPHGASEVVKNMTPGSTVTMLREWATGDPKWAFVQLVGGSKEQGYVLTQHLQVASAYSEDNLILPKSKINIQEMSPMSIALVPDKSWMGEDAPYYHESNGEWWFSVTLPYTCIEESGTTNQSVLSQQIENEASLQAVLNMYEYFDINPSSIVPTSQEFVSKLQSTYVKDYFLSTRPGSELMVLVVIPAIYVEFLKEKSVSTDLGAMNEDFCVSIAANSIQDLNNVQGQIVECLVKQYQSYLNSNVEVTNFSFENEIFKQTEAISQIKFLLKENGVNLGSNENQSTAPDSCAATPIYKKIKVCFDEEYKLKAVYYYNNKGNKKLLSNGLSYVKKSFPFNEKRFGYIFLNHKVICSLPELTNKTFFQEYVVDPKPDFKVVTYNEKTAKSVSPYGAKELGAYVDTALFLTSIAKEFGNVFDLNKAGAANLGYNCYSSNKAVDAFKLKALEYRDSQFLFTGDIMAFFQWICNLKFSDAEEAVEKAGKGKGDWGWEWLIGNKDMWEVIFGIRFSAFRVPTISPTDAVGEATEKGFKKAKDLAIGKLVGFFLRIKCELLLAGITSVAAIATGVSIAAYYASQGGSSSDGDDISALPSPAELSLRDYGGQNCNDILEASLGTSSEEYNQNLFEIFVRCGVFLESTPQQKSIPKQYLDGISTVTAPIELLSLLDGSASNTLINFVLKYTQKSFPVIYESKNTASKIASFFTCIGENTTQAAIDEAEQKIKDKANDVEFCLNLAENIKDIMKEKCPNPEVYENIYEKEFGSKIETYQEIISLLEDECNTIKINLFNNPETGEKGILDVVNQNLKGQDSLLQNLTDTLIGPIKLTLSSETTEYFSNDTYQSDLNEIVNNYNTSALVTSTPTTGNKTGTTYFYQIFSNLDGQLYYTLNSDGSEVLTKNETDLKLTYKNADPLSGQVQNIMNSQIELGGYNWLQNPLLLSRQQMVFYALVDNYLSETLQSENPEDPQVDKPVPYGFTSGLQQNPPRDDLFSTIFESFMERYIKKVGTAWAGNTSGGFQGVGEELTLQVYLNSYSNALSQNIESIMNYDKVSKEIQKYIDYAEYEDPNDTTKTSPKQYAIMNGMLNSYVRMHIIEYLAKALPFYEVFNFGDPVSTPYQLYSDLTREYIKEKIITDLQNNTSNTQFYLNFIDDTYDFVKNRSEYEIKDYQGSSRGLNYYLDYNFKSTYGDFISAMDKAEVKVPKSWVETGSFIYSKTKSLPVHNRAGLIDTFATNALAGYADVSSDQSHSLHITGADGEDRYALFRNGIFFIQNYYYIEFVEDIPSYFVAAAQELGMGNLQDLISATEYSGVLNKDWLSKMNSSYLKNSTDLKLSDIFKTVKFGSRLCYGIAYDYFDDNADQNIKNLAVQIIRNHQKDLGGLEESKSGNLTESEYWSSAEFMLKQKAIVCVDGGNESELVFFEKPKGSSNDQWKPLSGAGTTSQNEYAYIADKGVSSIVVPVSKVEESVPLWQSWNKFYEQIPSDSTIDSFEKFQNLNDTLINGEDSVYKALLNNCFSLNNMIHFNAISGLEAMNFETLNNLRTTKTLFLTNIKNIVAAKQIGQ